MFYKLDGFKNNFHGDPRICCSSAKSNSKISTQNLGGLYTTCKKKDRGQKIKNSPIHDCAENYNLKVRCPTSLDANDEFDHFVKLNPI